MSSHQNLQQIITQSATQYLQQAGTSGRLLYDFNKAFEKIIIETTLNFYQNNISSAAKALGISRTSLYKKIKHHNLIES
ncbi:helix-turn-helix domain-containing protein [Candidatus Synchoanobacter obligatus]|uniref:DNA binding HTH domain-containing protein n=1 Tax=Candidatus Synchoanobacter obligatus TaxID=2919597 RepID=A0ABT1L629_9GAMM|nr:helix-turn-helix domain-containing protein [Candidatus Synchoanobacter obligatus]MCP8352323.1 hypothetical protein [Candidatus Synchoanobacter obligatus]